VEDNLLANAEYNGSSFDLASVKNADLLNKSNRSLVSHFSIIIQMSKGLAYYFTKDRDLIKIGNIISEKLQ
jgi:hypothetical protein